LIHQLPINPNQPEKFFFSRGLVLPRRSPRSVSGCLR